jgi:hypothetical protein
MSMFMHNGWPVLQRPDLFRPMTTRLFDGPGPPQHRDQQLLDGRVREYAYPSIVMKFGTVNGTAS